MKEWRFWNVAILVFGLVAVAVPLGALHWAEFWGEWTAISHPDDGSGTDWQLPGVWGFHAYDIVNSVLLLATLVFVIRSIWVAEASLDKSHQSYVEALVDSRYDAMDRLYFDLLRERRERPHPHGDTDAQRGKDPYPLMVWNFIETIIDKCEEDPSAKLMKTWAPLISAEARDFKDFMREPSSSAYFKNEFMLLAKALIPASEGALSRDQDLDGVVFLRLFRALERIDEVARHDMKYATELHGDFGWLKRRLDKKKFRGFASPDDFLACFAKVHDDATLRKRASREWDLPQAIRYDGLKNNEVKRQQHFRDRYKMLIEGVLPEVS